MFGHSCLGEKVNDCVIEEVIKTLSLFYYSFPTTTRVKRWVFET